MINDEIKLGIKTMEKLCANPMFSNIGIKTVHIAGTNGKGSVGSFINAVLIEKGFKVGRYSSPAVFESREIFQINNENISENELESLRNTVLNIAEQTGCRPTAFEVDTAVAFCWFRKMECDYILLETGLGGRLDATNICRAAVSVITSVSIDHTAFLGNTIEEIAAEKAGIIKHGSKVVSILQDKNVMKIIEDKCRQENCRLIIADKTKISDISVGESFQSFNYGDMTGIKISLMGKYQTENCIVAIECCQAMGIDDETIKQGISKASWHGRFEKIRQNPVIIIDGAHNADGAKKLRESIDLYYTNKKIVYITGVFKDKEYEKIAEITADRAAAVFTVKAPSKRGLDAKKYAECIQKYNANAFAADNIKDALEKALKAAGKHGVIVCFGSLSFLKEIKEYNNEIQ